MRKITPLLLALLIASCGQSNTSTSPTVTGRAATEATLLSPSTLPAQTATSPPLTSTAVPQGSPDDQVRGVQATLPACSGNALYSASPIALDKISYILPLGNFTPLPSDHLYFLITRGGVTTNNTPTETVDLFSPGDVTVFQMGRQVQTTNGVVVNTDYYVSFAVCREVSALFGHVSSFSGPLAGIDFPTCAAPYAIGNGSEYEHCTADVNIRVRAGEKIGTAGGKSSAALDFGNDDRRLPVPYVANPQRHYDLTASCALDYYQGDLRAQLQNLLGHGYQGDNPTKTCGTIFQDEAGTLQGNWFNGTSDQTSNDVNKLLALAHVNTHPEIGAISFRGTIGDKSEWHFVPTHAGSVNREFSEVTPGSTTYCYQDPQVSGRLIIQLVSESQIKIEKQSSSCAVSLMFVKPFDYQR